MPSGSLLRWSASRPGEAITMWGRLKHKLCLLNATYPVRCCACSICVLPPVTMDSRRLMGLPRTANWSLIWNTNSLVGAMTSAKMPYGSTESCKASRRSRGRPHLLQDGRGEGDGLARAGLGAAQHVAALEHFGDAVRLHRRGLAHVQHAQLVHQPGGHAQLLERRHPGK